MQDQLLHQDQVHLLKLKQELEQMRKQKDVNPYMLIEMEQKVKDEEVKLIKQA